MLLTVKLRNKKDSSSCSFRRKQSPIRLANLFSKETILLRILRHHLNENNIPRIVAYMYVVESQVTLLQRGACFYFGWRAFVKHIKVDKTHQLSTRFQGRKYVAKKKMKVCVTKTESPKRRQCLIKGLHRLDI